MKKFLLVCFSLCFVLSAWAQERVITGRVTSQDYGSSLPGVNVVVKGTTSGTVTDADGKYSLTIPSSSASLVYSFIGLTTTEIVVGDRTVVDVQLGLDITQLTEVIVTAQGIQKDQKALGYAATTISSTSLANKPETDIGRALQGRTPGLQIFSSSGLAGSGTRVNIRGNSSITGNTQPLWIVDGVPINTSTNDINQDFRDGQVSPTRFLDLDPNNVVSMTVLRGLQATTTYGSQGRNGVILVTTKAGSSKGQQNKFEGTVSQNYFVKEAFIPEYQNKWANGFDGAYGEFFSNWGPLINGTPQGANHPYYEWRNLFPQFPEFATSSTTPVSGQTATGYVPTAAPNNVKDFFRTGNASTTSLNLSGKTDFGHITFNYSHLGEQGYIKNNDLTRDNFSFGGSAKLTSKLTLNSSFNFVLTNTQTPPAGAGTGSNSAGGPSVWANLFYTPRNIDLTNWPWENPIDNSSVYYRNIVNPYWLLKNSRQTNRTNRFFSSTSLNYKFNEWLNVTYRIGYDTYAEKQTYWVNKGGIGFDSNLLPGAYRTVNGQNTLIDHSLLISFNKALTQNFNLGGVVGYNYRQNKYDQNGTESLGQVVYGFQEHRNFTSTQPKDFRGNQLNYVENNAIQGVFVDANLDYKNILFINLAARNDWASILEKQNNSQFYPSASVAFIPTAAFPNFASTVLDFLKLRVAYGTSANFGSPYNTRSYYNLNGQARIVATPNGIGTQNLTTSQLPTLLANPDLKPELLTELEGGIEAQLFQSRIKVDLSLYNKQSKDQILQRQLDPSTGFSSTFINGGTIENKGIELSLTGTPIKSSLVWDLTVNFTKNISTVTKLPDGSKQILINGYTNIGNFAIEGQPYNVIQGTFATKSPNGQLIVNNSGSYVPSANIAPIADPNPQWLGSVINNITWKSFNFGMQWDYVSGGQVFSYTISTLIGRGVSKDLENFDPTLPLVLPGVNEQTDGSGTVTGYVPNTYPLTTAGVFFGNTIIGGTAPSDRGVFDATRVRFREISLGYNLPTSLISKLKLRSVNISVVGNNLWFRAINTPEYTKVDFDRTGFGGNNGAGFDFIGGPSVKSYGFNLKIGF